MAVSTGPEKESSVVELVVEILLATPLSCLYCYSEMVEFLYWFCEWENDSNEYVLQQLLY